MKLIIAGSRTIPVDKAQDAIDDFFQNKLELFKQVTEVVSGGAEGADIAGEFWAENRPDPIKVTTFLPDWNTHGKAAGPIRNKQMADYADALLCVWDGKSRGSKNMMDHMHRLKKPVYLVKYESKN